VYTQKYITGSNWEINRFRIIALFIYSSFCNILISALS